jgi:hypothetical protein
VKLGQLIQTARTGDVLLIQGEGFCAEAIRMLTGESFSHVAVLAWVNNQLLVAEFTGAGFSLIPVAKRLPQYEGKVHLGIAPDIVHHHLEHVMGVLEAFRDDPTKQEYGYLSLPAVLLAQYTGGDIDSGKKVCSTFAEACWTAAGYQFSQTPDPGDFLDYCQCIYPIEARRAA